MKTVTYKGPTDGSPSRSYVIDGERLFLDKPTEVSNEIADKLSNVEDHRFTVKNDDAKASTGKDSA